MDGQSLNIPEERIEQLRQIFPDVFSEGKVDFNRLKAALGEDVLFPGEHYELSWAGKAEARREVQRQTTATLVPDLEGSVDFDNAKNIFIEGENLEVLRVLQKSYFGKIKMIYIDPPYNTGNDSFVYPDDFAERQEDYLKRTGEKDEAGFLNKQDLWKKNVKESGHFHSVWLSMMYPRLYLARNLMREDGVIFVSIDDNEVANLRLLMDEVFGEENHVAEIIWQKRVTRENRSLFSVTHEYLLIYCKNVDFLEDAINLLPMTEEALSRYKNPDGDERGTWTSVPAIAQAGHATPSQFYTLTTPSGRQIDPPSGSCWRYTERRMKEEIAKNNIWFGKDGNGVPRIKKFLESGRQGLTPVTLWMGTDVETNDNGKRQLLQLFGGTSVFDAPKPVKLINTTLNLGTKEGEEHIILDFFAGSATTAQAVLELNAEDSGNRRFILVQMPEPLEENSEAWKSGYRSIADIGRARIRKAIERLQAGAAEKAKTPGLFEASENTTNGQVLGFQSYRLQYSNFKVWRNDLEGKDAILNQLQMFQEPLAEYRGKHSTLLTELVLKAGFPLTVDVTEKEVDGCLVFEVDGGRMWVALDKVTTAVFQAAAEARPTAFVTLSGLFAGINADETMANANLQLKEAGVDFKVI